MKKERSRRWVWVPAELLELPPMPPRRNEVLVRITEMGGEALIALLPKSEVRFDTGGA